MIHYQETSMIEPDHIKEIHRQLQVFGSKVSDSCLDGQKHALANVLHLACGNGKYGISIKDIQNIAHAEFTITCKCENTPKI